MPPVIPTKNLPMAKQYGFSTMQIQAPIMAGIYHISPALRLPFEIAMPPIRQPIVAPIIEDTFITLVHYFVY